MIPVWVTNAVAAGLFSARPPSWGSEVSPEAVETAEERAEIERAAQWALDVDEIERRLTLEVPGFNRLDFRQKCGRDPRPT